MLYCLTIKQFKNNTRINDNNFKHTEFVKTFLGSREKEHKVVDTRD